MAEKPGGKKRVGCTLPGSSPAFFVFLRPAKDVIIYKDRKRMSEVLSLVSFIRKTLSFSPIFV
jgi:hypothetical protein